MAAFGRRSDEDFRREIEAHLALDADRLVAEGLSPDEARQAAMRRFGNVATAQERFYYTRRIRWLDELRQDVRYALRTFRRTPVFATASILTLALGVGATTAIFSVVHSLLLAPLPYAGSERLVRLVLHVPAEESQTGRPLRTSVGFRPADIEQVQSRVRTLQAVGTVGPALMGFVGYEEAGQLQGARVTSSVFAMLGVHPLLGRGFQPDDEAPAAEPVIVLSHAAWQRYFGGDPQVIGRTLTLAQVLGPRRQVPHVVVGVLPPGIHFPQRGTQFWLPFPAESGSLFRGPLLAQLADGVSLAAAIDELGPIVREVRGHSPAIGYELVRERDEMVASVRPALLVLMGAAALVLLIACSNVASLLLARGAARQRELAVRRALGAGSGRLARQLLTESALLAVAGGLSGALLAAGGVELLRALATTMTRPDLGLDLGLPRVEEIGVDLTLLVFACVISLSAGVACGVAPAIRSTRDVPPPALREAASTPRNTRARGVLVVVEIALAMTLLVGGGLLVQSFVKLIHIDAGYDPTNVLTFQVNLPLERYPDERLTAFAEDLVARIRSLPAVRAAAYGNQLPLVRIRDTAGGLWRTPDPTRKPPPDAPDARFVSREYLEVMGIRVLAGRGFGPDDRAGQPRVLLVNEALVRRDFGGESPVGEFVYVGADTTPAEIVGVVQDVRQFELGREPEPQFFGDFRQWPRQGIPLFPIGAYYAVRTHGDPMAIVNDLRQIVSQADPQAKIFNVAPMEQLVASTVARPRLYAVLLGIFAAVAAALAAVGIFGLLAYSVAQRTREIGIRVAVGAQRRDVIRLVLRQSLAWTAAGILLGLAGAAVLTRSLEGMLFGVTPLDPATFGAAAAMLGAVAALAAAVPARRALAVDPLVALRHE